MRILFAIALALAALPGAVLAQTSVALGSLEHDTSLPVEVTSDSLEVSNEAGLASFLGNVVVIQGPMRLAAAKIDVRYSDDGTGSNDIDEMFASGGVTFTNGTDAAESKEATYNPDTAMLVMKGDVVLTQGPSVMSGQVLTVDLGAGTGAMEGRVRTVFQTGNQ
ncbi:MAG: LptA/OstA family protein [Pseudomonadota bacterium]